ncbi:cupin domain-containing protein [Roseovarius sp. SK2]|uniref:cupin domain-containing protein n=1 Tax=Roseovarius TaxID=74030 RepID=UPI00237B1D97|nr:cupin domain-containing protein [Roseovarius sp. SK2]MDD9723989.1 cupin domain-containing protein [Roseovarius sp. SK2]
MKITRPGTNPSSPGPAEYFTGTVRLDPLFTAEAPGRAVGLHVTFGKGRVRREGGPVEEIRQGDVVWFPADEKHWHGASPDTAMSHIAIQESIDGSAVRWMEKVSDEDYDG